MQVESVIHDNFTFIKCNIPFEGCDCDMVFSLLVVVVVMEEGVAVMKLVMIVEEDVKLVIMVMIEVMVNYN